MQDEFSRTRMLLGSEGIDSLKKASVIIFGIGGVGSYTAEALARSGVGRFALVDNDEVCLSNINRQLIATRKTIGMKKVGVMRDRIFDINPEAETDVYPVLYTAQNADSFDLSEYDYIVDAIDTISSKIILIERAAAEGIPIISSMGAGNKLNPTQFEVADIYKTSVCPLAKVIRSELRKRNISSLKVVYSKEQPIKPIGGDEESGGQDADGRKEGARRRQTPGSVSFVPSVAGLIIASEVVKDIVKKKELLLNTNL